MTLLIDNNEPLFPGDNPSPQNVEVADEVFDVIDFFYPQTDYVCLPQLYMRTADIMNVMNCSIDEAVETSKAIRAYFGDRDLRILVPHFSEYLGVDELFIYIFLISLNDPREISHQQKLAGHALKLGHLLEKSKDFLLQDRKTLRERSKEWHILNPYGEPSFKPLPNWRMVIHADEVAVICRVHLRTAQKMLQDIRTEIKMKRKLPISIRTFCFYNPVYTEDEIRMGLAAMYGEEYDGK